MTKITPTKLCCILVAIFSAIMAWPEKELDLEHIANIACTNSHSGSTLSKNFPLEGTIIAITGATSGIGLGLTEILHGMGATIIAIGRSSSKSSRLKTSLDGTASSSTLQREIRIVPIVAELSDLNSVSDAAEDIQSKFTKIDFLINNAGMAYDPFEWGRKEHSTVQGYDLVFGVNYLSHFLLTEKLLPLLKNSSVEHPKIIQMTSSFHTMVDGLDLIPFSRIPTKGRDKQQQPYASRNISDSFFHSERSYANSKLAQVLHMRSLARKLHDNSPNIQIISVCPGWVGTSIGGKGLTEKIIGASAFSYNGRGIASTLEAMFQGNDKEGGQYDSEYNNYYINSGYFILMQHILSRVTFMKSLLRRFAIQDMFSWSYALIGLHVQKFFTGVYSIRSSPLSYDISLQDLLYEWSKEAVSNWL